MTEQTAQRPSPEGSVLVHELNHRVNNEVAAAISVALLAATRSGNDKLSAMRKRSRQAARTPRESSSDWRRRQMHSGPRGRYDSLLNSAQ